MIEEIVEKHAKAYQQKNMEKFVETCHHDIKMYDFNSGELVMDGTTEMKKRYKETFEKSGDLKVKTLNKIVFDNIVIVHTNSNAGDRDAGY